MIQMFDCRCSCGERFWLTWGNRLTIICLRCDAPISVALGRSFRTPDTGLMARVIERRASYWLQLVRNARVLARRKVQRHSPYQVHKHALQAMAGVLAEHAEQQPPREAGRRVTKARLRAIDWMELATHLSKSYDQWYLRSTPARKAAKRVRI